MSRLGLSRCIKLCEPTQRGLVVVKAAPWITIPEGSEVSVPDDLMPLR